ncbi:EVH1 domain-containing protein [Heterostelium album PN500]|uniref:EVH1 domain-containing protein n=1 Tax=Heterostelium pallidum (strain ATCC 26659 / Pp 5 / PN500) TaxID=670386 RepID=D3BTE8_HETP5|nr:EVH1 domain-containing protein [Heterostelium album PN500]EFA75365.1 EVH1 domain-containing protein [Heterostelium album PN500]|eukprot:XP_020427499.1 EVH1 domain-containing protein [Heterostelium album PN500]
MVNRYKNLAERHRQPSAQIRKSISQSTVVLSYPHNGKWEDKGTGFVNCLYIEALGSHCLMVKSEEDGSIILESKVYNLEIYQRQQDTLIVWAEPNTNIDLAISFQDSAGCQDVWDFIILNQRRDSDVELIDLPEVNAANLDSIRDCLDPSLPQPVRDRIVNVIVRDDYLKQLLELFDQLEQSNDIPNLHHQFTIFKNLILFNDSSIFELLLSEEYLLRMMGVLEYDPEISEQNRIRHREFLSQQVIFKEVVKFSSESLISTIHQTFRVQYLKDVVLPRVLDDLTFSTLNSIIYFNNSEIVGQIQKDTTFLQKIFTQIQQSPSGSSERRDLLLFLQELCGLAKNLQIQNKSTFFLSLSSLDLFKTLSTTLDDDIAQTRISTTEIILSTLSHDTRMLRNYITLNSTFLSQLINGFIKDNDIGVKNQIVEIIKVLLEADTTEMNEFFKLFYEKEHCTKDTVSDVEQRAIHGVGRNPILPLLGQHEGRALQQPHDPGQSVRPDHHHLQTEHQPIQPAEFSDNRTAAVCLQGEHQAAGCPPGRAIPRAL